MVAIIVTNTQMGVSFIEKNRTLGAYYTPSLRLSSGFLISKGPISNFALKTKKVKQNHGVFLKSRNCGEISVLLKGEPSNGGIIEKEFEFKPSFDEYLKAMESVKSVRQKRKQAAQPSTRDKPRNGEENGKLGDLDEEISGKKTKLLVQDKEGGKLKVATKMRFEEKGNAGIAHSLVRNGLEFKQSGVDVKAKRKLGIETENGRWTNNRIGSVREGQRYDKFEGERFRDNKGHQMDHFQVEKLYDKSALQDVNRGRGSIREVQSYDKFEGDRFRDNNSYQIRKRDHFQGEKRYAKSAFENVKRGRGGKLSIEDSSDDEMEMDRAAFKSLEKYNDVYDQPRVSRMDMEERIQMLAKCLNGSDIDMPEWMFSKMMRSAKIRFADHSMLRVIQILGKLGNWRRVLQVIEWIQSRERFKSHKIRFIYTAALDALGKARRPVEALNVFHAMQQQMSSYPDLVAYHCIAVTLGQAGHMKELFDVIDSMQSPPKKKFKTGIIEKWDPRLKPDIVVYNAVLNACVHRKKWEGAFWVLQQLKEEGQQPTSTTYGLIMEVMFACDKYNLVHDFFKKVQKSSIPNALTYKVLVNTHWREGNVDKAVSAVQDMERRGIIGSSGLYYDLARSLCSAGRCQEALMQIDKICKVANKPLVVTYTGLIQACLDSGNIQNGVYIFNHMHKFCSPNLVTCNIMLKAYLEHEMFDEAKGLFQKLVESGNHISSKLDYRDRVLPDIYTFNLMLDACTVRQSWDDLEFIYKRMLQHGFHFNAKRHLRMILDACRAGKMELLETTWKHLVQADQIPSPLLIKQMLCMKLEQDDYAAAFLCVSSYPLDESQEFSRKSWLNFFRENSHRLRREILVGLVHEISNSTARSDSLNLVLQNLYTSCKEFLRAQMTIADLNQAVSIPQSEAALMF